MVQTISLNELRRLIASTASYRLIDVRNKDELVYGMIPSAKNIPLPEFEEALQLSENEFEKRYGFPKMNKNDDVIVHCRTGGRSAVAAEIAARQGYRVRNFIGSIWEWATIDPKVKRYGPEP